ncbi:MAG: adenosylcobinamide-GDP ribazoletransferase [Enterobacterales bacterium]|nr:adenosylcobinamide-GDP ribazoletransferase [Enterobacterales bacterium]MDN6114006.1 adenosylcobinamide-GDP ribazoletransferase [Enterobacterales bacterium]MDN6449792.1 adenosylcobinamide-GDP ribazoletransferase [Enterobacterales bacterium]MDN6833396.1 adenosylcobinamide-GDP ribazoletransferase [Enterobacterales bacterium]
MKLFLATLQFMTRIPVPARWTDNLDMNDYAKGVVYFPFVGLIVGLLSALAFAVVLPVYGPLLAAVAAVLATTLVTGAFHLDGLADTCDGIFSARPRERILEIMRDSRIGSNGALALIFVILARVAIIYQLTQTGHNVYTLLVAAPALSRALLPVLMYQQKYARENGMGNLYIGKIGGQHYAIALIIGLLMTLGFANWHGGLAAIITYLFALLYRGFINKRIGGQTGDTIGAGNELFGLIFLFAVI